MRRQHPGRRGHQRRRQLLGRSRWWSRAATSNGQAARRGSPRTSASRTRADVKAIVDDANAQTAVLRNQVIGTQQFDIKRAPDAALRVGDGEHGRRCDAARSIRASTRRTRTPAACARTSSVAPPSAGEQPCEITWGEMFAVLPFGNRTVILTLTGAQLAAGVPERVPAVLRPDFAGGTGRFPQISGLKVTYTCNGTTPVVDRHVEDAAGHQRAGDADRAGRHRPLRHQRLHVHGRRRLHRLRRRAPTSCSRATTCCRSPSTT